MTKAISPEHLFARLGEVWQAARGARAMPARNDISPAKAGGMLHYTALLDVVDGDQIDFRYRLLGQHLIDSFGKNVTGALHGQTFPAAPVRPVFDALRRCVETGEPQEMAADFRNHHGTPCRARAQVWPLSEDGHRVTGLLAACVYLSPAID